MKPIYPLTQTFEQLPSEIPLYPLENALLPGGELPLELSKPADLALFIHALKTDQLIGMVQPHHEDPEHKTYTIGCSGRIRQYRERKDGRLNIMLTGVCRYRILETSLTEDGFTKARVDWNGFANDYETEVFETSIINEFKDRLRDYFDRHSMQVDWNVLDKLPVEQVVNNLILVMNLDIDKKQQLLEAISVKNRVRLFTRLLKSKTDPIIAATQGKAIN